MQIANYWHYRKPRDASYIFEKLNEINTLIKLVADKNRVAEEN